MEEIINSNVFAEGKKFVDFAGLDYFWGKAKSYVDAADAAIAKDLADHSGNGDIHVSLDDKAKWNAAEGNVKSYVDEKIGNYAAEGVEASGLRKEIDEKIAAVAGDAKSYSLGAVSVDESNVAEAWGLFDEDGTQAGSTIKIYKDRSLKEVKLDGQILKFTYNLADGTEQTVDVNVSTFLAESEFGDGLKVVDSVVSVKVDEASESFLSVSESGVKVSGVQDAIDAAVEAAVESINGTIEGNEEVTAQALTDLDGRLDVLEAQDVYVKADVDKQIADNSTADQAYAKSYTDQLFASVVFASEADIDTLFAPAVSE